jgi:hypothetical protein
MGALSAPPAGLPQLWAIARGPARVAGALPSELRGRVASVEIAGGTARLLLTRGPEVRLGPLQDLKAKSRAAAAVLATLGSTPVRYIDVQSPSAPVVGAS